MTAPRPCSDAARERCDPLEGTAAPSRGWLLIEHPGPWAPNALAGSRLDPTVVSRLSAASVTAGVRILLVRRPGRQQLGAAQRWWLLHGPAASRPDGSVGASGTWADAHDLLAAAAALDHGPGPDVNTGTAAGPDLPPDLPPDWPRFLICTHGRHDTCCAVRGRPVAAALARRWPQSTWECSHLGGDRFAPNLLVVPDGTCYGAVDDTDVVALVSDHLAGRVDVQHLRGPSSDHPWEQSAVVQAHRTFGPLPASAVVVEAASTVPGEEPRSWAVELTVSGVGTVRALVRGQARPRALLTCRATHPAAAGQYSVTLSAPSGGGPAEG